MLINAANTLPEVFQLVFDEILLASKQPSHPFRFMSLATVRQQSPDVRYVVLRSVGDRHQLVFFSDYRTEKIAHISENPNVSVLLYHPQKMVQVRIKATAAIHRNSELALYYWNSVAQEARKAYNSSISPGTPLSQPEEAHSWPEVMGSDDFVVVEVVPSQLDVLQLNGLSHLRARFLREEDNWDMQWVAP